MNIESTILIWYASLRLLLAHDEYQHVDTSLPPGLHGHRLASAEQLHSYTVTVAQAQMAVQQAEPAAMMQLHDL